MLIRILMLLSVIATVATAAPPHYRNAAAVQRKLDEPERKAIKKAARLAVDLDTVTPEDAAVLAPLYDPWTAGEAVAVDDVRSYDGGLYRCAQAHTTQSDWTPPATPALWVRIAPPDAGPQPWVQPAGAHDAYNTGDRVTYTDKTWESTVDANVWAPGVYGWVQI